MCRILTHGNKDGVLPKYVTFQCTETSDVFVGSIRSGAWMEHNTQDLSLILNDLDKKNN